MNAERWQRVKQLLDEAIALDDAERRPYLDRACAADFELRHEVESLLASHKQAGTGFLKSPAINLQKETPTSSVCAGRRVGVYQIVEEIGRGGMGEIYRAVRADGQYTKEVAVKLVRGGFDTAFVLERFRTERQILATLDHPNIARLLDGGTTDDGIPYLVMELIEGTRIDLFCDEHRLPITQRLQLFRQVCGAVQYAHQRLVIHRDIKPSNILVTKEGVPKLLDFGIAKILDPASAAETTLVRPMTPEYASPEQIRGEPITTATDVYSLGVVLYQLLTGRSPYPTETRSSHELARAVCETDPGRPSVVVLKPQSACAGEPVEALTREQVSNTREGSPAKLRRRLAGDLDNIVLRALRKEPPRRYASVEQFAEDLRRHLEGLPVTASKGSWSYRAGKFVRRHRVGMTAAALVVFTLLAGVAATIRQAQIARAERARAEKRFNDVRKLANSLMFEVHDSIASLPGATPARKLIVQKSLEYLDSLAREASGDISLQRELAAAFERVGEVQGDTSSANLGDTPSALASYVKSLAIRQSIARANPNVIDDQVALGGVLRRICGLQLQGFGDVESALGSCRQAVSVTEAAAKSDPANQKALVELVRDYSILGQVQSGGGTAGNMNDPEAGLENRRKALALAEQLAGGAPADLTRKQQLVAVLETAIGEDSMKLGDRVQALQHYQQAREIFGQLAKDPGNDIARRRFAIIHRYIGDVFLTDEKFAEARAFYEKEVQLTQSIAEADPKDLQGRMFVAGANANLGFCLVEMNRPREGLLRLSSSLSQMRELVKMSGAHEARTNVALLEVFSAQGYQRLGDAGNALAHYSQALQIYSDVLAANPKDAGTRVDLAELHDRLGSVYLKNGNTHEAAAAYREALATADAMVSANPHNTEALYAQADTYAGLGDVSAAMARKVSSSTERSRQLREAQNWYEKSLGAWQEIRNPSRISPKGFEVSKPHEIARRLAECKTELAHAEPTLGRTPR